MEMKADINVKKEDMMFHKIYIQKHDNVRYANAKTAHGVMLSHLPVLSSHLQCCLCVIKTDNKAETYYTLMQLKVIVPKTLAMLNVKHRLDCLQSLRRDFPQICLFLSYRIEGQVACYNIPEKGNDFNANEMQKTRF